MELTGAEWDVMECLWDASPRTGRELAQEMAARRGWSRSTTLTLLRRLETKGAVTAQEGDGVRRFSPAVRREDAALREAESFLDRVYKGSVSLLVSALTQKQALSRREIDELYAILQQAEKEAEDNDL